VSYNPRPPLLAPNPLNNTTSGVPYAASYTGPQTVNRQTGYAALPASTVAAGSSFNAPQTDPNADVQKWEAYVAEVRQALQAAAGQQNRLEYERLRRQYEDAEKGRQNAMALARLSSETSRYGVDVGRQNTLDQLKENARQFDANHGLEQQKLGLTYAQTATDYLSTPDRYAQGADFINMATRALSGQGGPAPYGTTGTPIPKTEQSFEILANGGNPYGQQPRAGQPDAQGHATNAAAAGGAGSDARVQVIKKMFDAVPPSESVGLDDNDFAVLRAAQSLMSTRLQPGTLERMRPDQQKIYKSYVQRSGRSWDDYLTDYQRSGIGQGNVRSA
jgi:hypothetical protein